jgi:hypothetical protein
MTGGAPGATEGHKSGRQKAYACRGGVEWRVCEPLLNSQRDLVSAHVIGWRATMLPVRSGGDRQGEVNWTVVGYTKAHPGLQLVGEGADGHSFRDGLLSKTSESTAFVKNFDVVCSTETAGMLYIVSLPDPCPVAP